MRILITGAMGFIGRFLLEHLRDRHELFALAREQDLIDVPDGVTAVVQDLTEPLDSPSLPSEVDAVIHLAQSDFYRAFPDRADDMVAVNIASTVRLLGYAKEAGAKCFLCASTGGLYGRGDKPFTELDPVNPPDFYTATRRSAELLLAPYAPFFRTVVFRFFFVYGAKQRRMLVPMLMGRILKGETLTIQGNPGIRINPTHVLDAVQAIEAGLVRDVSGIFNIAGDETVSITELVELMSDVSGRPAHIEYTEGEGPGGVVGNNERMKSVLGVQPHMGLREGLAAVASEMSAKISETGERST